MSEKVRVLVVDDAAFMRRTLIKILAQADDIEVVGQAVNGVEAVKLFNELRPDVICLDVDMPEMNGVTALKHFMSTRPTPVIVVSSMTERADIPFELFRLGVIEFFPKPSAIDGDLEESTQLLLYLVRNARHIRLENLARVPIQARALPGLRRPDLPHVVVMGGVVGSIGSFIRVLSLLPRDASCGFGMVCMVPLHRAIANSFLGSVSRYFGWETIWLTDTVHLQAGRVCMVPCATAVEYDGHDIRVASSSENTPLDTLFANTAGEIGGQSSHILLAGTGIDGVHGLQSAFETGARCYIQDPQTALFSAWRPDALQGVDYYHLEDLVREISTNVLCDDVEVGAK